MTTTVFGRGAWTRTGMPANGSVYYELVTPEAVGAAGQSLNADLSHRAVNYGVKAIQQRINEFGYSPKLPVDGILGAATAKGIVFLQGKTGAVQDGQFGPNSAKRAFWPYIAHLPYTSTVKLIVGGICQHESGFDPGAVGYTTPDDLGLVQINGPANPTLTEAQRFDYHVAYKYAADRIVSALLTPGFTVDAAIASYGYPAVAAYWVKSGTETYPNDPALNILAVTYKEYVKAWTP